MIGNRGRHKAPSATKKNLKYARDGVVVGSGALAIVGLATSPAMAAPSVFDVIAECESHNQNIENSGPSTASGYFQITDGTWKSAGGLEFASRAIQATYEQQLIVAQRIADRRGSLADWNASKGCWGDKISNAVPAPVDPPTAPIEQAPVDTVEIEQQAPSENTYIVIAGDSLVKIAKAHGTGYDKIAELNNIKAPYTIYIGQVLNLPTQQYTVQKGDTLGEIAGSNWRQVYSDNISIIGSNPNLIKPGQVLFVGGLLLPKEPVRVEESVSAANDQVTTADVVNPMPGTPISSGYGYRWGALHDGIDFDGKMGDPFYSATAGVVKKAGSSQGFGHSIVILTDDGTEITYGHMYASGIHVTVGDRVVAGQHIGDVGADGDIVKGPSGDGSHLHFRIHVGPGSVNPAIWLADHGVNL